MNRKVYLGTLLALLSVGLIFAVSTVIASQGQTAAASKECSCAVCCEDGSCCCETGVCNCDQCACSCCASGSKFAILGKSNKTNAGESKSSQCESGCCSKCKAPAE